MREPAIAEAGSAWVGADPAQIHGEREVLDRAVQVIGDRQRAMRWLGTPVRVLGYQTPISVLHDADGVKAVMMVLGRLEHGVL